MKMRIRNMERMGHSYREESSIDFCQQDGETRLLSIKEVRCQQSKANAAPANRCPPRIHPLSYLHIMYQIRRILCSAPSQ